MIPYKNLQINAFLSFFFKGVSNFTYCLCVIRVKN
jgi:hypothetical protein